MTFVGRDTGGRMYESAVVGRPQSCASRISWSCVYRLILLSLLLLGLVPQHASATVEPYLANATGGWAVSSRGVTYSSNGTSGKPYVYNTPSTNWFVSRGHRAQSLYVEDEEQTRSLEVGIVWTKDEHTNPDGSSLPYAPLGYYFTYIVVGGQEYRGTYGGPTTVGARPLCQVYERDNSGHYLFVVNGVQVKNMTIDFTGLRSYSSMAVDQTRTRDEGNGYDSYFVDAAGHHVGDLRASIKELKIMPSTTFTDWNYARPYSPFGIYSFYDNLLLTQHWGYVNGEEFGG